MTEEQIKEQISRAFMHLVAARRGFKCTPIDPDHGTDVLVSRAVLQTRFGVSRWADDGRFLQLQLKCSCDSRFEVRETAITYDLEVKTYNDLVSRLQDHSNPTPFYLVVLRLPDDPEQWISIDNESLLVRRTAYWYRPAPDSELSPNQSSVRVSIPRVNTVDLQFLPTVFATEFP